MGTLKIFLTKQQTDTQSLLQKCVQGLTESLTNTKNLNDKLKIKFGRFR